MKTHHMRGKKFGPIGRCIYCGSNGGQRGLSDEHIIPYALDATAELLKASCFDCAKITSEFERYCGRHMFGDLRIHHNFPTRRRKERPTHLPLQVNFGNRKERVEVPASDHPSLLILPAFSNPGMLLGLQPSGTWPEAKFHVFQHPWNQENLRSFVAGQGGQGIEVTKNIIPAPFARMLAKIAHAFLVAMRGLGGFEPLLPDVILGRDANMAYLVGGALEVTPPSGRAHELYLREGPVAGRELFMVQIRLFANVGTTTHGTPTYCVVAGERMTPAVASDTG